jgi:hypothetical protein
LRLKLPVPLLALLQVMLQVVFVVDLGRAIFNFPITSLAWIV